MNQASRTPNPESRIPTLAFVFPGQGSQSLGMLGDLAAAHPGIVATFSEASDGAGIDLWALAQNGPQADLDRTDHTQPALLAAGVAVWRAWLEAGGARPAFLAGHSLGEYTALVCAGVLSLRDAAGLVAERGRLMQAAVPPGVGAMAAVLGGEPAQIESVCAEVAGDQVVAPANFNAPGQIVLAGHAEAVDRALARLADLGVRKAIKLAVSVPSHCALMRDAAAQLARRFDALTWSAPELPVVRNIDARISADSADARAALERQLYEPVRWSDGVAKLADLGVTRIVECGPGKVLSGLVRRIDRSIDARSIGTPDEFDAALAERS